MNSDLPAPGMYNSSIKHAEIVACRWVHRMNCGIDRTHPKKTEQGFDFNMNLFAYV